jgi:hypothetical protein
LTILSEFWQSQTKSVVRFIGAGVNNFSCPPNQSLKLTEVAVDDLARAKQPATIGHDLPRADWIPSLRRFAATA